MEKHIEKMLRFIEINDPFETLNTLSKDDKELKEIWRQSQSDREWSKINSCQDVEFLIKYFENCVLTSPFDIRTRNAYKFEMLVAQYKAMRGLRKWCQAIDGNPISPNPNFPKLNESDVEEIISRLEKIIRKI